MGPYLKRFVYASLLYLGLAAIFGVLNGMTDIGYFGVFAHSHFNLLGFMSMMVFGIGYFIIPRFNGADLKFESWVAPHFWLANISLIGMVLFRGLSVEQGDDIWNLLFIISAMIQTVTIFMFIINIWLTLSPKVENPVEKAAPKPAQPIAQPTKKTIKVSAESKISDLVDAEPALLEFLANNGLAALKIDGHLAKVRQMGITLGMASANHGLNLGGLIEGINQKLGQLSTPAKTQTNAQLEITPNVVIGEIIANYPESRELFEKYFGNGCFDCPGQSYESLDMACRIHSIDPSAFLKELKEKLGV